MSVGEAELRRYLRAVNDKLGSEMPSGKLQAYLTGQRDMLLELLGEGRKLTERRELTNDDMRVMYDLDQHDIPGYDDKTFHGQ